MAKTLRDLGWYQDPDDVHYNRFWDGHRWTDMRGRARSHPDRVKARRLANLGGLVFGAIFVVVSFLPTSQDGQSCGTWLFPSLNGAGLATKMANLVMGGGTTFDQIALQTAAQDCNSHLATLRLVAIAALILGIGVRWGIPYALRQEYDL